MARSGYWGLGVDLQTTPGNSSPVGAASVSGDPSSRPHAWNTRSTDVAEGGRSTAKRRLTSPSGAVMERRPPRLRLAAIERGQIAKAVLLSRPEIQGDSTSARSSIRYRSVRCPDATGRPDMTTLRLPSMQRTATPKLGKVTAAIESLRAGSSPKSQSPSSWATDGPLASRTTASKAHTPIRPVFTSTSPKASSVSVGRPQAQTLSTVCSMAPKIE